MFLINTIYREVVKWMDSKLNTRQILIGLNYFFHTHFDIIFSFVIMLLIKHDKSFHHLSVLIVLLLLMKRAPGFISGVKGATFGRIERERQALLKFKDLIDNFGILSSWFSSWDLLATYSSLWFSKIVHQVTFPVPVAKPSVFHSKIVSQEQSPSLLHHN